MATGSAPRWPPGRCQTRRFRPRPDPGLCLRPHGPWKRLRAVPFRIYRQNICPTVADRNPNEPERKGRGTTPALHGGDGAGDAERRSCRRPRCRWRTEVTAVTERTEVTAPWGPRAAAGGGRRSTRQRPRASTTSEDWRGRPHHRRRHGSCRPCRGTDTAAGRAREAVGARLRRPDATLTALGGASSSQGGGKLPGAEGRLPGADCWLSHQRPPVLPAPLRAACLPAGGGRGWSPLRASPGPFHSYPVLPVFPPGRPPAPPPLWWAGTALGLQRCGWGALATFRPKPSALPPSPEPGTSPQGAVKGVLVPFLQPVPLPSPPPSRSWSVEGTDCRAPLGSTGLFVSAVTGTLSILHSRRDFV